MDNTIFKEYYEKREFIDRFLENKNDAIDVIIPVYHTNDLWKANLYSIYREVPINRLLISDGGCIDDSIEIVKKFPRVEVFNHRSYKTLGKCIVELIRNVETEWFIYLHSDVYLPTEWFDRMIKHKDEYDWYGCPMNITALINYKLNETRRPYAGSQIGKKEAFVKGLDIIDDDYVYRQEDFVFNKMVEDAGYKTGKVEDTFHYHQIMFRKSKGYQLEVIDVSFKTNISKEEESKADNMQIKGIVKYLDPVEPFVISNFKEKTQKMIIDKELEYREFKNWIDQINPNWNKYFNFKIIIKIWIRFVLSKIKKKLFF